MGPELNRSSECGVQSGRMGQTPDDTQPLVKLGSCAESYESRAIAMNVNIILRGEFHSSQGTITTSSAPGTRDI